MTGLPFQRGVDALDLIEKIVGEVALDEDYRQRRLDRMTEFWNTKICDRYPD